MPRLGGAQQRPVCGGLQPGGGGRADAEVPPEAVGRAEAEPRHLGDQAVGVGAQHLRRFVAVGGHQARGVAGIEAVGGEEGAHRAERAMLGPGGRERRGALRPDPRHLAHPLRARVEDLQRPLAEVIHDPAREGGAQLADQPRAEVARDGVELRRRAHVRGLRPELRAVPRVGLPAPAEGQRLPRLDRRQRADDGDRLAPPAGPHAHHAEAVLRVIEGDALDRPLERRRRLGLGHCAISCPNLLHRWPHAPTAPSSPGRRSATSATHQPGPGERAGASRVRSPTAGHRE